ncbi:MAG: glycoside hydrolase family 31 protein [Bacteroidales bacterium]|nr:glycoside hydrolase family 31 protein [Bacteroidales bacterium]MCD8395525.1 glycoside hydrolase family 31 protein [Bacteroidales bacterium]
MTLIKSLAPILILGVATLATDAADCNIPLLEGEQWYGAATDLGPLSPLRPDTARYDLKVENFNNQTSPLLLSSRGRYVWTGAPFTLSMDDQGLWTNDCDSAVAVEQAAGATLRDAYLAASAAHFPASDNTPPEIFFDRPIFNTWIELVYDQNQADVLRYARSIIDHGFTPGVLMIDDNWQKDYGVYAFRPDLFPSPKEMVDTLHELGFKVMLWVSPFVSPDSKEARDLNKLGYLVKQKGKKDMAVIPWWNGHSAAFDLSNPQAYSYLKGKLTGMQRDYGIDGFKFDGGDPQFYMAEEVDVMDGKSYGPLQTELWAQLASEFPYHELRACWKMGNRGLVQRLGDKKYSWEGVGNLVPAMISAGLIGHAYTCPDMIGGGEYTSFQGVDTESFDPALIVRSCQIHSMMPMMQFSVAPWRVLKPEYLEICKRYARWHEELGPYILDQVKAAAKTGEPIVRHMAYAFPGEGFEEVNDQYMLGDRYLVAPVATAELSRSVKLPKGKWRDDQGRKYSGGKTYTIDVPLDRLPYFEKIK